jgi:hypothetical protein
LNSFFFFFLGFFVAVTPPKNTPTFPLNCVTPRPLVSMILHHPAVQ